MAKLLLLLPALFAVGVKASCFWGAYIGCRRASESVVDTRSGLDKVLEQPSLSMRPASEALLRSLKKTDIEAKEFRNFFYAEFVSSIKTFDQIEPSFQANIINVAFAYFLYDLKNYEAAKSLINNHVLPAYPILAGHDFDFEAFLGYVNPHEDKNLASFLNEKVFIVFNGRLDEILTGSDSSIIRSELNDLFSKAYKSIYSADSMVKHSFQVFNYTEVDLIRKADAACSKISSNLENYMVCAVKSLQEQMFAYLSDDQCVFDGYLNFLTRAILNSAAKHGLKEIVHDILVMRSSATAAKGLSDPDFIKVPFRFACNNEQLSIMELIIDAEPSIRINSDLKCSALSLATRKRNDKLFYHLLGPSGSTNKIRQISSDIVDSIEFAIKDNNLDYCNAILNKCNMIIPNDLAKWMADAMGSRNHPLEEVLMNNSSRLLREFDFEQFKEAVQSRNSEKVRTLWDSQKVKS